MTDAVFAASVFLRAPDRSVLLVRHKGLGLWLPVGGKREGDELPIQTAIREVREETGIELEGPDFPNLAEPGAYWHPRGLLGYGEHVHGKRTFMTFEFLADVPNKNIPNPSPEHEGHWWVAPEWASLFEVRCGRTETTPSVLHFLRMIAEG